MHTPHSQRPLQHTQLTEQNVLHVVAVVSNPVRFLTRYGLYERFRDHVLTQPHVHLTTVELAFGDRHHEVTAAGDQNHVQVRSRHELWHKENMVNLGIRTLPRDWRYAAWVDADVEFLNPQWAQETLHQLQHHPVVQMFESAVDLGPTENVHQVHRGFGAQWAAGAPMVVTSTPDGYGVKTQGAFWHPGFAWACTRKFYENTGGLIDRAILGAGDHHMALGIIGKAERSLPGNLHPNYRKMVLEWQERAQAAADRDLGFVPGSLLHHWHGKKADRGYISRWGILQRHQYDPVADIRVSEQGVYELAGAKQGLRDDVRRYFRSRNEDSRDE